MKHFLAIALTALVSVTAFADSLPLESLSWEQRDAVMSGANSVNELQLPPGAEIEQYPRMNDIHVLRIVGDRIDARVKLFGGQKFEYSVNVRSHQLVSGSVSVVE